ncbi:MAG: cytochrome c peroxidase [Patiriisocius sp.]|jgi:cytochrome c peroxidase
MKFYRFYSILFFAGLILSCTNNDDPSVQGYIATPLELAVPAFFTSTILPPIIPENNPLTVEGVALGKKLFFDPILSSNNTLACANCHRPENAFTDPRALSIGVTGEESFRNSMPLHNLAFNYREKFNWDGSATTLEQQMFVPVTNPVEMNNTWPNVENALQSSAQYPILFEQAFGTSTIDSTLVTKAMSQFVRTLISGNSKFDKFINGTETLTPQEENGLAVFLDEGRGDCFHCHGLPESPLWTDNAFHNNGLDETFTDLGLGGFSGDPREFGLFRSPTLRNLAFTAPYMHDGRFETLDEVIDHYSEGLVFSETIDPLMKAIAEGGVQLTESDKADLKAFLLTLSDPSFTNDPNFRQ